MNDLFQNYLLNVSFPYEDGEIVEFDRRGDPPGRYVGMSFVFLIQYPMKSETI